MLQTELLGAVFRTAEDDGQIAVAAAELIDEFLFGSVLFESNAIAQFVKAAHVGCFHTHEIVAGGVLVKKIVKDLSVVKILGNGDAQVALIETAASVAGNIEQEHSRTHQHGNADGKPDSAHAGGDARSHGQEDEENVTGGSGYGAEADKAECAQHRNACAGVAVDHEDDKLNDNGQSNKRHRQAAADLTAEAIDEGYKQTQGKGYSNGDKSRFGSEIACGVVGVDRFKHDLLLSFSTFLFQQILIIGSVF